ncbi:MAG: sensor histidine kinase [Richelia sp.]|nr:sensor histidine kinase [Richelia sp.]
MLISASSEFIALCREQMALLSQGLGASLSVVYLTQELGEVPTREPQLIPILVYPETATLRQGFNPPGLPQLTQNLLGSGSLQEPTQSQVPPRTKQYSQADSVLNEDKIILPLIHDDLMMGLLVTARGDRQWTQDERGEVERVAQTLAIACILDQRRAWLQQQLQQQQILQEQQQDLLDSLLHQFRNPLTALRTFGKLLMKRLHPGEANRDVATSIVRESDRLQELLKKFDEVIDLTADDLKHLHLADSSEVVLEATVQKEAQMPLLLPGIGEKETNCNLQEILEPLLVSAEAIAQEINLKLISKIEESSAIVKVNKKALTEVLTNIVDNALKYTPSGGKILIKTGKQEGNFQGIFVSDTGPGIPPEDLEHLGERYYRGIQEQTAIPGTGLGLAIAKQLLEQMQGKLEVFSPTLESAFASDTMPGTTFVIWLPQATTFPEE